MFETIKSNSKLEQILLNFIDVLRINIFMVDIQGKPVLIPKTDGFGFSGSSKWGALKYLGTHEFLAKFQSEGQYLKAVDPFDFHYFAVPIGFQGFPGYLMVGPVILSRQLDQVEYQRRAAQLSINPLELTEFLSEIRTVSFNSLKSILDLLSELSQYALKMNVPQVENPSVFTNLLDLAMTLTQAECGSIMLFDKATKKLHIQVYKGLDSTKMNNVSLKLGEGIVGLVAEKKEPFVINEGTPDNRISHLLTKPELKSAVVLPILGKRKEVLGVLSVSTHHRGSRLVTHPQELLKSLSQITSNTAEQLIEV